MGKGKSRKLSPPKWVPEPEFHPLLKGPFMGKMKMVLAPKANERRWVSLGVGGWPQSELPSLEVHLFAGLARLEGSLGLRRGQSVRDGTTREPQIPVSKSCKTALVIKCHTFGLHLPGQSR